MVWLLTWQFKVNWHFLLVAILKMDDFGWVSVIEKSFLTAVNQINGLRRGNVTQHNVQIFMVYNRAKFHDQWVISEADIMCGNNNSISYIQKNGLLKCANNRIFFSTMGCMMEQPSASFVAVKNKKKTTAIWVFQRRVKLAVNLWFYF